MRNQKLKKILAIILLIVGGIVFFFLILGEYACTPSGVKTKSAGYCDTLRLYYDVTDYDYIDSMYLVFKQKQDSLDLLKLKAFNEVWNYRLAARAEAGTMRRKVFREFDSLYKVLEEMSELSAEDFLANGNIIIIDTARLMMAGFDSLGKPYLTWQKQN